ncbi:apolipoprotein acyltransferase [Acidimangrovimonas sediminis]|uniref:apolipoprotein acyltransferase n=1 Tax=Acidimangrovimonas sediminis TaxID=2056283 RepID=UPI000C805CC6|nr:apolipoprotein acyltransferase [Acidimangrovimonas sediminis]
MIVIAGVIVGALLGAFTARRRGGSGLDVAQYAAVYAIVLGLLCMFATIAIERMS